MRKLDSKTRSCSELEKGNRGLLRVKQEAEKEEELQRKIKAFSQTIFVQSLNVLLCIS